MKTNIYLTGFMGCGKSTLAPILANQLGLISADLDAAIEKETGKSLADLFESVGESAFREIESRQFEAFTRETGFVVALGGGTICNPVNLKLAKESGMIIWLNLPEEVLWERLKKQQQKRPLIASLSSDELKEFIHQRLAERKPYYSSAHIVFDPEVGSLDLLVQFLYRRSKTAI